ncbi:uncharacterized protein V1513DRAFT_444804 [Lipomyces chichibuensis]|uniref:uncharacterized protein n=1 Tax=Lipomyces chichibuensis TaxID=1546026 RepID=UPI003343A84B
MNSDVYSLVPTHRTAQFAVRDDCSENEQFSFNSPKNDVANQVNLLDRYPNESLIERRMSRSDGRFLMPAQPARLNVMFPLRRPERDLDDGQGTLEYQVFRKEYRDRSGASPETLAAISEYLNSPDTSSYKDMKVKAFGTYKSSDSNKENVDPDLDFGMPVRDPDRSRYGLVNDSPASDKVECSMASNIIDENFEILPPPFEMSESISEINFNDPPSFRKMLSTSTVKDLLQIRPGPIRIANTAGNMYDYSQGGSQTSSVEFATQPHMYANCNSEEHQQLIANLGYQRAASFSTGVSGTVSGKYDTFLAGEYVKRPVLRNRKFSLKLNIDSNKGYLGGTSLEGEICIKLKRLKENETVHISRVEIATVCVEEVGSSKRIIDSRKLFMRSDVDICNAGLNVIPFSAKLPKNFGPGYFAGPRAKIRYLVFLCASADQNDTYRLLRTSEEIKFYNATNVEHPTSLRVSRVATKTGNVRFVGSGSVSIKVESARDYYEAGKYCYLRTNVFNHSSSVVSKLKMSVVRCIEYLDAARRTRKTQERVITSSIFKATRDGWPKVEPMTQAAYTSAVRIPEFAVSIISSGFRVDYHVDVSVGGSLRQYVIARFPLTLVYKPDRFGPLIASTDSLRRHDPGLFSTREPLNTFRKVGPNLPFERYRDTLSRNADRFYCGKTIEDVPMQKNNFGSKEPVSESRERLQTQNVVLRRDVKGNNGVDGFYSMRSMQDRELLARAANERLRQLLTSIVDHARTELQRASEDTEKLHDWDYMECNMPAVDDNPILAVPTVAVTKAKDDVPIRVAVDNSKCFV